MSQPTDSTRLEKGHSYHPNLDVPPVPDLDVPFAFTYSLPYILPSYRSGMSPDHDQKDSVYPTEYMFNSLVISDPPLVQTWAERHLPLDLIYSHFSTSLPLRFYYLILSRKPLTLEGCVILIRA
jgi:hypothetical protein